ncbi:CO dehydrogenase/CO-methylating acetyl-CoA synthase complex subunit beta [Candidatus Bathyarchaeota archaeon]|nr:CO dehydrogenase/CO-methylating acetyl-CoA synthase complex subunit beta [Candidatus Bathyarchaeota archaeon]
MFKDIPVDVGVIYEGERVRKNEMQVEFGGTEIPDKFELVRAKAMEEVEDGKVAVIGPDIKDLSQGSSSPLGILIEVAGDQLEQDLEGVVERRIHYYCNYVEGLMHLNQRYDIWLRLSRKSYEKGFDSFHILGKVLARLFKSELPIIKKIQITFITDPERVKEFKNEAMKTYDERDAKARGLKDEEVDSFYGCTLCQSFAPSHICVITPQRYANCGAISWFDGRAAARVDPKGPVFTISKGELLDPLKGEFSGVNQTVKEKSLGEIERVYLYSAFGYPHTSCGCFEAIAFYIPEADGFGIVHRDFKGQTVNGLPFSTMADSTAGGRQVDGFHGISIEYLRSTKFLQADGGWARVVWMPSDVKERVKAFIPPEVEPKILTEKEAQTLDSLIELLKSRNHPVVERWKTEPVQAAVELEPTRLREEATLTPTPYASALSVGSVKIVLKGAKIKVKKMILKLPTEGRSHG